jgi:phosphoglycolate phosphatase
MRLLISDLDGTLVDTFPDLYASALLTLEKWKIPPLPLNQSFLKAKAGTSAWELLYALGGERIKDLKEEIVPAMIEIYRVRLFQESRPFPGTERWFESFAVAIVTNKPRPLAEPIVEHFFRGKYVLLLTPEDTGAPKPSPLPYARALQELGEESALVVGDDRRDYDPCIPLNLPFVVARYGYIKEEEWTGLPPLPGIGTPCELLDVAVSMGYLRGG